MEVVTRWKRVGKTLFKLNSFQKKKKISSLFFAAASNMDCITLALIFPWL